MTAKSPEAQVVPFPTKALTKDKPVIEEGTDVEIADATLTLLRSRFNSDVKLCEGDYYVFDKTHWRTLAVREIRDVVYGFDKLQPENSKTCVKITKTKVDSIVSILRDRAEADPAFFSNAPIGINCASGFIVFDSAGKPSIEKHLPKHRQRHCLSGCWPAGIGSQPPTLLSKLVDGSFKGDPDFDDKRHLISELCGLVALGGATALTAPKAVIFHGASAANGKSQFLAMLRGLAPGDSVSAISPSDFGDEKKLIELRGRRLNTSDELGRAKAIDDDKFKSVITGDEITARGLYKDPVSFRPQALNVFATNDLPAFRGGIDNGVRRRLMVVPFNRTIPNNNRVAEIGYRIAKEESDALLAMAVNGAARILASQNLTEPKSSTDALRKWIYKDDPVREWLDSRTIRSPAASVSIKTAYADFKTWAIENGHDEVTLIKDNNFAKRLRGLAPELGWPRKANVRQIEGITLTGAAV